MKIRRRLSKEIVEIAGNFVMRLDVVVRGYEASIKQKEGYINCSTL